MLLVILVCSVGSNVAAEVTLWGIYGEHDKHDCPVNNRDTAEAVVAVAQSDLGPLMKKYGVTEFVDRYHSGLEHTFLWAVKTTQPHDLEEFSIELGLARWNNLKFVPLRTFNEGVVPAIRALHGLEGSKSQTVSASKPVDEKRPIKNKLYGIYGEHDEHDCPVINRDTAVKVNAVSEMDLTPLMKKYGITRIVDQYHSGLEHTFLWAVETDKPHDLEEFTVELGIANWNHLKFVPLRTFEEGVLPDIKALHGLDDRFKTETD
jgi:hypothetical protein